MADAIVFLPGLQSDHRSWAHQLSHFEGSHTVVVPSGHHNADSLSDMASIIAPQLPERFHLVAWSMGGYVAFQMLPAIANRIISLTLIATSAREDSADRTRDRRRQIAIGEKKGMAVVNRNSLMNGCVDQSLLDTAPLRAMSKAAVEIGLDAYRKQQEAIIARQDRTDRLSLIHCPTSILVGEADTTTPPAEARIIHAAIPGSTLQVIQGASHCLPMEKPDQVNSAIESCIARARTLESTPQ